MNKIKLILLVIPILYYSTTFSQNDQKIIDLRFNDAVKLFENENYSSALKTFNWIVENNELNSKTTVAYLFKAKCEINLKNYSQANKTLTNLLQFYPKSKYRNEALVTFISSLLDIDDYYGAMNNISNLIDETTLPYYVNYAKLSGKKIALNYLSSLELIRLYNNSKSNITKPYILYLLGQVYFKEGDIQSSKNSFKEIINFYPKSEEYNDALTLYNHGGFEKRIGSIETIIGVMLPFSKNEDEHSTVNEILQGVQFAVDEYNKARDEKIGILIRNTERNRERIFEIRDEFENIPALKVIIGPLFSDEVGFANEAFNRTDIPLISPTATENGLTLQNSNFFQANPSFETRGKIMANYAFNVDTVRRAAILNASDTYSALLAQSFANEFTRLGGQIWANTDYVSGSYNFKESVDKINKYRDTIQCIYLPISNSNDAAYALSYLVLDSLQVDSLNIKIYGNQDWFSNSLLKSSATIGNNLVFTSDYFIPFRDKVFELFNDKFYYLNKYDVNRNVLYGYDIAKYLLSVLNLHGENVYTVSQSLKSSKESIGYHNNIIFDSNRVNKYLNLINYDNGIFKLIGKFKLNN